MKKISFKALILGIVSFSIVFVGCKKNEVTPNNFTFNNSTYTLQYGALENWGKNDHTPATYNYQIMLTTKGISYNSTTQNYTGTGSFITLSLNSKNALELDPGLYTFDRFNSLDSMTIDEGYVGTNCDIATGLPDSLVYKVETGIIEVTRRSGFYEFNIDVYVENQKPVKAYYTGMLDLHTITGVKTKRLSLRSNL